MSSKKQKILFLFYSAWGYPRDCKSRGAESLFSRNERNDGAADATDFKKLYVNYCDLCGLKKPQRVK